MTRQGYLLGLDIGSSSIKASLVNIATGRSVATAQSPGTEMEMVAKQPGWAEQDPDTWWHHIVTSTRKCLSESGVKGDSVEAIGIAYQMHGLVLVDDSGKALRPSIIWCDSRAVTIGERAFSMLGSTHCLTHYLNSPGNFTASKLRWVKENEPAIYQKIAKAMLPGDFIALKLTGEITTTDTGLSEGIFWDFKSGNLATELLDFYEIDRSIIPSRTKVFGVQGELSTVAAKELGLTAGVKVAYRAGDQPNNAFSLNVLNPGETAATAGTSGVIYSVTDKHAYDVDSRVNTFIHVTNGREVRNGILLCINGTGILNRWMNQTIRSGEALGYARINDIASQAPIGALGLTALPFGNGAERVLKNRDIGGSFNGLDFNRHHQAHLFRAAQEGIVFALKYGFEILDSIGTASRVIRAGHANMFLSPLFREAFVNTIGAKLELYNTDGAQGAAIGAGVGAGIYKSFSEAFSGLALIGEESPVPAKQDAYRQAYEHWRKTLAAALS